MALNQLHGEEVDAVGFFHGKDGDNMRMIERGHRASFTPEPRQSLWIAGHLGREYFQRHVAPEFGVGGAIYLAHSASTDF